MKIYHLLRNWLSDARLLITLVFVITLLSVGWGQSIPNFTIQEKGCVGEEIQITNTTQISTGDTLNYKWIIGDTTINSTYTTGPLYTWDQVGTYLIRLIIENQMGDTAQITKTISVKMIPRSDFNWDAACETIPINFDAQEYSFNSFGIINYIWSFGDSIKTGQYVDYKYDSIGTQKVSLEVVSDHGCRDTLSKTIDVLEFIKVDFTAENVCEGDEMCFKNLTDDSTKNYRWKFGDGAASSDFRACHTYRGPGVYSVTLTVFNSGCTDLISKQVIVYPLSECPFSHALGNVHQDTSSNCIADSLNSGPPIKGVKMLGYINGILKKQMYTDVNGFYGYTPTKGDSLVVQIDTSISSIVSCPISGIRSTVFDTVKTDTMALDFGIKCQGVDLVAWSISGTFRPTRHRPVYIQAGDFTAQYNLNCADGTSGTVTTTITGSASYVSPLYGALTPTSVVGKTLTYNIANFGKLDPETAFNITVSTDSIATIGSDICIETIVSTSATDVNSTNDTLLYCGKVVNSLDPNDKAAYPSDVTTPDSWITYTIRFQNTGTDTAYNIVVADTLSPYLDESSFRYLAGSVTPEISLTEKAILFNYQNINLLDSFSNEPYSHGWVQYKVKTVADLQYDDVIKNTAFIYFDQNDPVVTNTTFNVYVEPTSGTKRNSLPDPFKIYPNPTNGSMVVEFDKNHSHVQARILSITGQEIVIHTTSNANTLQFNFEAAKGIYFVEITTENGAKSMVRVVKE